MRAAALALLLAGCGSSEELVVSVSATSVRAALFDNDCSCRPAVPLGDCRVDEVADGECDACATSCEDIQATRSADRATLTLDGCGKHVELAIPTEYPAAPVATAEALSSGTRVTWQVDATTSQIYLVGGGGSTSEVCVLRSEQGTVDLEKGSFLGGGIFIAAQTYGATVHTPWGSTRVRADSPLVQIPTPPR